MDRSCHEREQHRRFMFNYAVIEVHEREPSVAVRETTAEQLEERQIDWVYSKPVVILAIVWNFAFVIAAGMTSISSRNEVPETPLRLWIAGCVLRCVPHMVCVCFEYRRRRRFQHSSSSYTVASSDRIGGGNFSSRFSFSCFWFQSCFSGAI
jgi:hypothetical protein